MPTGFKVKIFGVEQVNEEIASGIATVNNMEPALNEVADDMMGVIERTFSGQGRRGGGSWQFLSESWAKYKDNHDLDPRILFAHHALYNSWTVREDEDQILDVSDDTVTLDSAVPYAAVHQYGGGPKNLPKRPYIDFLQGDVDRWAAICQRHIYESMSRLT